MRIPIVMRASSDPVRKSAERRDDAVFAPAPRAGSVRVMTWIAWAVVLGVVILDLAIFIPQRASGGRTLVLVMMPAVFVAMTVCWFCSRIRTIKLSGQILSIKLTFWSANFDLSGLRSVELNPDALKGSIRTFGNGGFGAFHGYFRSKRMGKFRAYVTDANRAVVLRWEDKCAVVSPKDTEYFIEEVCKRTGVRRLR